MKNALILHGTNGHSSHNWFPWLKQQLESRDWNVWVPNLPHCEKPDPKNYIPFILGNKDWEFNNESVIIGHSSGAVSILHLLQSFPKDTKVDTCILVGTFNDDLGEDFLSVLFDTPLNFDEIKKRAKRIVLVHSDDDPYCPLEHAEYQQKKLDAELVLLKGQKHFSVSTAGEKYKKFPELLKILGV